MSNEVFDNTGSSHDSVKSTESLLDGVKDLFDRGFVGNVAAETNSLNFALLGFTVLDYDGMSTECMVNERIRYAPNQSASSLAARSASSCLRSTRTMAFAPLSVRRQR